MASPCSDPYDPSLPLEDCNALSSQLFEVSALQRHHIREVAQMASALENEPMTTSPTLKSSVLEVEQYIDWNYVDMVKDTLKKNRKQCALSYRPPADGAYFSRGVVAECLQG